MAEQALAEISTEIIKAAKDHAAMPFGQFNALDGAKIATSSLTMSNSSPMLREYLVTFAGLILLGIQQLDGLNAAEVPADG